MTIRIDEEIRALEERIARRRHEVEYTARIAKQRALRGLLSPMSLLSAAALGFVATFGVARRRRHAAPRAQRAGRIAGLASILGSVVFALLRAQFGSPAQMAQLVLSKLRKTPRHPA
jgi:hypothetical protein